DINTCAQRLHPERIVIPLTRWVMPWSHRHHRDGGDLARLRAERLDQPEAVGLIGPERGEETVWQESAARVEARARGPALDELEARGSVSEGTVHPRVPLDDHEHTLLHDEKIAGVARRQQKQVPSRTFLRRLEAHWVGAGAPER